MAGPKKPGMSGIVDSTFSWSRPPSSQVSLTGKTLAVVGGTNGLGRAIALLAAERGARVIVVGRTFRDAGRERVEFLQADLSKMREADRVAAALAKEPIDLLVLTSGIFAAPKREVTPEGLEQDMAVSYLSRLAVLRGLVPKLLAARDPKLPALRVFVMGFPGTGEVGALGDLNSERGYRSMEVHMSTVAGNEALVLDGVHRHPEAVFVGLNPGLVKTGIRANVLGGEGSLRFRLVEWMIALFTPTPETYAERIVPLLVAPELAGRSGVMFNQKVVAIRPSPGLTKERVEALLAESDALVTRARAS